MNDNPVNQIFVRPEESLIQQPIIDTNNQTNNAIQHLPTGFFESINQTTKFISVSTFLTGIIIIIGIVIICRTSPKQARMLFFSFRTIIISHFENYFMFKFFRETISTQFPIDG